MHNFCQTISHGHFSSKYFLAVDEKGDDKCGHKLQNISIATFCCNLYNGKSGYDPFPFVYVYKTL